MLLAGVDWTRLAALSGLHGLEPLLYSHFNQHDRLVPDVVLARLRSDCLAVASHNLSVTKAMFDVLEIFERDGIRAMPFKGPVLAATLYGGLALRQFSDIDILIEKSNARRAKRLLTAHGYVPQSGQTDKEEEALLRDQKDFTLHPAGSQVAVEVHWAFTTPVFPFPLDFATAWDRAETVSIQGREVRTLGNEDLLLVLCVHGAKHTWSSLKWVCDIAELMRAHPLAEWEQILSRARSMGCETAVLTGVLLASDLMGMAPPRAVLDGVRKRRAAGRLASEAARYLLTGAEPSESSSFFFNLRMRDSISERVFPFLRFLSWRLTPNQADREVMPLPRGLSALYYVVRPARLAWQYGFRAVRARLRSMAPL